MGKTLLSIGQKVPDFSAITTTTKVNGLFSFPTLVILRLSVLQNLLHLQQWQMNLKL